MNISEKIDLCVKRYEDVKNIKLVSEDTGIPWQTVYWYLKKAKINVTGNKSLYGSTVDRFAAKGEEYISVILPSAEDQNQIYFQPKIDFFIKGYGLEIKSSKLDMTYNRWAFSLKKQKKVADYFILLAFDIQGEEVIHHFLIPNELVIPTLQTISISKNIDNSKWRDFLINKEELIDFFENNLEPL
jgi:hypothetical protein